MNTAPTVHSKASGMVTLHYIRILSYSARALQSLYKSGKESENKWVLSLDLKLENDECCDDDVTSVALSE